MLPDGQQDTQKTEPKSSEELVEVHGCGRQHDVDRVAVSAPQLEAGKSEALTAFLDAMVHFPNYSFGNVLLIARQKPDATHVAGMWSWNQLGRRVKRGEKGIRILPGQTQGEEFSTLASSVGPITCAAWSSLRLKRSFARCLARELDDRLSGFFNRIARRILSIFAPPLTRCCQLGAKLRAVRGNVQ